MVLQNSLTIDLSKYGVDGYISVGYPSLRKLRIARQNASSKMVKFDSKGQPTVDSDKALEADLILETLVYIEEAPFELMSVDAFFDFTDEMDKKRRGAGQEFFEELMENIQKVKDGEASPSAVSQAAETVGSA